MAQYPDLATLRSALTSDDPERRSEAYGEVYESTDFSPTEVLNNDDVEGALIDAGVLETPENRPDRLEQHGEIVALLERIAEAVEGS